MGNPYPVALRDASDVERFSGEATFTDPGNQPGNGGSSAVLQVRKPITSAELLDLVANPVEIVATPGPGKAIQVVTFCFTYLAGLTPYTDHSGALLLYSVVDGGLPQNSVTASIAGFLDQATDQIYGPGLGGSGAGPFATASVEDLPLLLAADHDPTDGDGTLIVSVTYTVLVTA